MADRWTYQYGENTIVVENTATTETLYINNEVVDTKKGIAFSANLTGKLPEGQTVTAEITGSFGVGCDLYVDDVLQQPVSKK